MRTTHKILRHLLSAQYDIERAAELQDDMFHPCQPDEEWIALTKEYQRALAALDKLEEIYMRSLYADNREGTQDY